MTDTTSLPIGLAQDDDDTQQRDWLDSRRAAFPELYSSSGYDDTATPALPSPPATPTPTPSLAPAPLPAPPPEPAPTPVVTPQPPVATPPALGPVDNSTPDNFIRTARPYAEQVERETGIPASYLLAMAASESNYGKAPGNNFGGIKAAPGQASNHLATWESVNGQHQDTAADFAAYGSPLDGFRSIPQFLAQNGRYAGAVAKFNQTKDAAQLVRDMNAAGYATDPNWANNIIGLAGRFGGSGQGAPSGGTISQAASPAAPSGNPLGDAWDATQSHINDLTQAATGAVSSAASKLPDPAEEMRQFQAFQDAQQQRLASMLPEWLGGKPAEPWRPDPNQPGYYSGSQVTQQNGAENQHGNPGQQPLDSLHTPSPVTDATIKPVAPYNGPLAGTPVLGGLAEKVGEGANAVGSYLNPSRTNPYTGTEIPEELYNELRAKRQMTLAPLAALGAPEALGTEVGAGALADTLGSSVALDSGALNALKPLAGGLAGAVGQNVGPGLARRFGATPEQQDLAGDVAGAVPTAPFVAKDALQLARAVPDLAQGVATTGRQAFRSIQDALRSAPEAGDAWDHILQVGAGIPLDAEGIPSLDRTLVDVLRAHTEPVSAASPDQRMFMAPDGSLMGTRGREHTDTAAATFHDYFNGNVPEGANPITDLARDAGVARVVYRPMDMIGIEGFLPLSAQQVQSVRSLELRGRHLAEVRFDLYTPSGERLHGDGLKNFEVIAQTTDGHPQTVSLGSGLSLESGSSSTADLPGVTRFPPISTDQTAQYPRGFNASNRAVQDLANAYQDQRGASPVSMIRAEANPRLQTRIANWYDNAISRPQDKDVIQAYKPFGDETDAMFRHATQNGYVFEPWTGEGQPYANSQAMQDDVRNNKHLFYFTGGEPHPLLTPEQNEHFRAMHDLFGHAMFGNQFGPAGEEAAYQAHAQMYSPLARQAMATETRGQNSWVNFFGNHQDLKLMDRPYAEQKATILPDEFQDLGGDRPEQLDRLVQGAKQAKGTLPDSTDLTAIAGAPSPNATQKKLIGMPTSMGTLLQMATAGMGQRDWYTEFGQFLQHMVSPEQLDKVATLFGLTSDAAPPSVNLATTARILATEAKLKAEGNWNWPAFMAELSPENRAAQGLFGGMPGKMVANAWEALNNGSLTRGGNKTVYYHHTLQDAAVGEGEFRPVIDRWIMRALGFEDSEHAMSSDDAVQYGRTVLGGIAKELSEQTNEPWRPDQVQAAIWFEIRNNPGKWLDQLGAVGDWASDKNLKRSSNIAMHGGGDLPDVLQKAGPDLDRMNWALRTYGDPERVTDNYALKFKDKNNSQAVGIYSGIPNAIRPQVAGAFNTYIGSGGPLALNDQLVAMDPNDPTKGYDAQGNQVPLFVPKSLGDTAKVLTVGALAGTSAAKLTELQRAGRIPAGLDLNRLAATLKDPSLLDQAGGITSGLFDQAGRYFHGTTRGFAHPDPSTFDADGLYGPGYYLTDNPRVASSYAMKEGAVPQSGPISWIQHQIDQIQEIANKDGQLYPALAQKLSDLQGELEQTTNKGGPNVRAINVPPEANLLDIRGQVDREDLQAISDAYQQLTGDAHGPFTSPLRRQENGSFVYSALTDSLGGDKAKTNQVLSAAGFDGITHEGGLLVPLKNPDGTPVRHNVVVMFADKLDKLTNELSGEKLGSGLNPFAYQPELGLGAAQDRPRSGLGEPQASPIPNTPNGEEQRALPFDPEAQVPPQKVAEAIQGMDHLSDEAKQGAMTEYQKLAQSGASEAQKAQFLRQVGAAPMSWRNGSDWNAWFKGLRYNSMLSSPSPIELHLGGNATNVAWKAGRDVLSSIAERDLRPLVPEARGALQGIAEGLQNAGNALRYGVTSHDLMGGDVPNPRLGDQRGLMGAVGKVLDTTSKPFEAVQEFYEALNQKMELGRLAGKQASREGLSGAEWNQRVASLMANPDPTTLVQAHQSALRQTFQSPMGNLGNALATVSQVPLVGNILLPFVKTVYNLTARGIDRTPVGLAGTMLDVARGGYRNGATPTGAAPLGERLADNLLGSALTAYLATQAQQGNLTGEGPDSPEEQARLARTGWKKDSVRLPNGQWLSYENWGPLAQPLGLAAALADSQRYSKSGQDQTARFLDVAQRWGKVASQAGLAKGTTDLLALLDPRTNLERRGSAVAAQLAGSLVPFGGALNALGNAQETAQRAPEGFREDLLNRSPFQDGPIGRNQLPAALDVYGRPKPPGVSGVEALTPLRSSGPTGDQAQLQVDKELGRLGIEIGAAPSAIGAVKLSKDQERQYQAVSGPEIWRRVEAVVGSAGYSKLSDANKIRRIRAAVDQGRTRTQTQVVTRKEQNTVRQQTRQAPKGSEAPEDLDLSFTAPNAR